MNRLLRVGVALAWLGLVGFLLAGCAARPHVNIAPPPPRIVTVDRVVVETCLRPGDVLPLPAGVGVQINGDAAHDTQILASALLAAEAWEGKAMALLEACSVPQPASHQ